MEKEYFVGGLSGWVGGFTMFKVRNCYNAGQVSSYVGVSGGVVGYCGSDNDKAFGQIEHCYSYGSQTPPVGSAGVGTLIGCFNGGFINDCVVNTQICFWRIQHRNTYWLVSDRFDYL